MTKNEYISKYESLTKGEYFTMTKTELLEVIADFWEGLHNGIQEYYTPIGTKWFVNDEIKFWARIWFKNKNIERDTKEWLVTYILVLDSAYLTMNEIRGNHRYHGYYENR